MDGELKTWLEAMAEGLRREIQSTAEGLRQEMQAGEERMVALIAGEVGSLHAQITGVEERIGSRLESIDARLKLQAGLIQSGARAMARFSEFAENSEERWVALVSRVEILEAHVQKLNGQRGS